MGKRGGRSGGAKLLADMVRLVLHSIGRYCCIWVGAERQGKGGSLVCENIRRTRDIQGKMLGEELAVENRQCEAGMFYRDGYWWGRKCEMRKGGSCKINGGW